MSLLSHPTSTRPKAPRRNKRRLITQQDSQTTLREEDEIPMDGFDIVSPPPPPPPKLDMTYEQKTLPITPHDSTIYLQRSMPAYKPATPPPILRPAGKQSKWKSAVGKIINFRRVTHKPKYVSPPLSPASSRQPSFYGPAMDQKPHRSAVTLLNSAASTLHTRYDEDDEVITNIGLSRSSSQNVTPVTPHNTRGFHPNHFEPITTVLQRADLTPSPTPVTALPITPATPAPPRTPTPTRSLSPPRSATPPSRRGTPPIRRETPPLRDSPPRTMRSYKSFRSMTAPVPAPARTPSPPPMCSAPRTPPHFAVDDSDLILSPLPSPSPSPPPMKVQRRQRAHTVTVTQVKLHSLDESPKKKAGPRILQAHLPSPVSPDPKNHVFTGPWFNRRGDEWLGISPEPGQYRVKQVSEEKANDPKYIGYPEEPHHFMNPSGDVMDALTLKMVSKSPKL